MKLSTKKYSAFNHSALQTDTIEETISLVLSTKYFFDNKHPSIKTYHSS
jgi:hypothetical protein